MRVVMMRALMWVAVDLIQNIVIKIMWKPWKRNIKETCRN